MSLTVSVCCGAGVSPIQGEPTCGECLNECATETIAERDHRMRVEGAVAALDRWVCDGRDLGAEAERIVREMKEGDKR